MSANLQKKKSLAATGNNNTNKISDVLILNTVVDQCTLLFDT